MSNAMTVLSMRVHCLILSTPFPLFNEYLHHSRARSLAQLDTFSLPTGDVSKDSVDILTVI